MSQTPYPSHCPKYLFHGFIEAFPTFESAPTFPHDTSIGIHPLVSSHAGWWLHDRAASSITQLATSPNWTPSHGLPFFTSFKTKWNLYSLSTLNKIVSFRWCSSSGLQGALLVRVLPKETSRRGQKFRGFVEGLKAVWGTLRHDDKLPRIEGLLVTVLPYSLRWPLLQGPLYVPADPLLVRSPW